MSRFSKPFVAGSCWREIINFFQGIIHTGEDISHYRSFATEILIQLSARGNLGKGKATAPTGDEPVSRQLYQTRNALF